MSVTKRIDYVDYCSFGERNPYEEEGVQESKLPNLEDLDAAVRTSRNEESWVRGSDWAAELEALGRGLGQKLQTDTQRRHFWGN